MHDRYETSSRGDNCRCRKGAKCASCMGLTQPERSEALEDARSPFEAWSRRTGGDGRVAARPATRVDDVVIFAGGASRELTADELRRLDAGEDVRLDPRSGRRTPLVGESLPSMTTGELIFAFEGYVD